MTPTTSHQQQTQRTFLGWLRVEYDIAKPSSKFLSPSELNSDTWVSEVKRLRRKKHLLPSGLHALRDEYTRTLAAEALTRYRVRNAECGVRNAKPRRP